MERLFGLDLEVRILVYHAILLPHPNPSPRWRGASPLYLFPPHFERRPGIRTEYINTPPWE
jgi:hypothetical protein